MCLKLFGLGLEYRVWFGRAHASAAVFLTGSWEGVGCATPLVCKHPGNPKCTDESFLCGPLKHERQFSLCLFA